MKKPKNARLPPALAQTLPPSRTLQGEILEKTRNGEELLNILLGFARGDIQASPAVRLSATMHLGDRAWGKAVETHLQISAGASASAGDPLIRADLLEALARAIKSGVSAGLPQGHTRATLSEGAAIQTLERVKDSDD